MLSAPDIADALAAGCTRFLYREAEMLDDARLHDWLMLLAVDIDYRIPTRITREHGAVRSGFSDASYFMQDDFASLRVRVQRFDTDFAFAEDPPTRTRRIIGNVRCERGPAESEIAVKSNFILFRTKMDQPSQLLAGERHDLLRSADDGFLLARRTVFLEHTVLPMENLAIFL